MDRRSFLATTFASIIIPKCDGKELVLDYTDTSGDIHRGVVVTSEIGIGPCVCEDHYYSKVMVLDAKRAWILPDGRMEVERFMLDGTIGKLTCGCVRDKNGEVKTYTTILNEWVFRKISKDGWKVYERHSERT